MIALMLTVLAVIALVAMALFAIPLIAGLLFKSLRKIFKS
jgi:hypothetical protein